MTINLHEISFLTSNAKKAADFSKFDFNIKTFNFEKDEILSDDVSLVALYKALHTDLDNILVEDTSLDVEGAKFFGTEIKHVWEEVRDDDNFNSKKATWKIALCLRKGDELYISTASLPGILQYPIHPTGYHFDRIFSVFEKEKNQYTHFEGLSDEKKLLLGPRFQALRQLVEALQNNNYKNITIIKIENVPSWSGDYQVENQAKEHNAITKPKSM